MFLTLSFQAQNLLLTVSAGVNQCFEDFWCPVRLPPMSWVRQSYKVACGTTYAKFNLGKEYESLLRCMYQSECSNQELLSSHSSRKFNAIFIFNLSCPKFAAWNCAWLTKRPTSRWFGLLPVQCCSATGLGGYCVFSVFKCSTLEPVMTSEQDAEDQGFFGQSDTFTVMYRKMTEGALLYVVWFER